MCGRSLHGNREISQLAQAAVAVMGPHREGEEPTSMMHGGEKSDPAIVAGKPTNKAASAVAESVEPRAGPEGNVEQQSTHRAQNRTASVTGAATRTVHHLRVVPRLYPREEPYVVIPLVRICAGGAQ